MRLLVTIAAMVASIWLVCSELQGQSCLDNFTNMPNFVLDLNDSVSSGATFLTAPALDRVRDCLTACCRSPSCNVALVERDHGHDDIIHSCFLLNCVYKQEFVCKFVRKEGFGNYVTVDVSKKYLHRWEEQEVKSMNSSRRSCLNDPDSFCYFCTVQVQGFNKHKKRKWE